MWRNSDIIQNQWFSDYSYFLARPKIHFLKPEEKFAEIKMFSGNGIFGKAEIMKKYSMMKKLLGSLKIWILSIVYESKGRLSLFLKH